MLTQQDCFDEAASYILKLEENLEKLKQRKQMQSKGRVGQEVVEVRYEDLNLEVVVVSGVRKRFMFHELINVLEEEGAEIVSASVAVVGDKIFHTIHSQVCQPVVSSCCHQACPCLCQLCLFVACCRLLAQGSAWSRLVFLGD